MKEFLRGEITIRLEAAVLKRPNAELYLYLSAHRVFVCFVCISEKKSEVFPIQHSMIRGRCLLRGTNWVFKQNGLDVFEW
jgi:hypothetical protein